MRWFVVGAFVLAAFVGAGFANTITPQIGGGFSFDGGISAGGNAPSPPPPNACASIGNQLDFSDTTGCNLVWAGH